jgi:shikimate dehydrogenase
MNFGKTTILGVIGDPIKHSYSPFLHQGAAAELGLTICYVPFHVRADQLPTAVAGLKALGVTGFNVTVPHKEAIIPYLDDCDPDALAMGAVNTVINRKGVLTGYNTDGLGFIYALTKYYNEDLVGKRVVFIGAGGTAKALGVVCLDAEIASLTIINRTLEKAESLKDALQKRKTKCDINCFKTDTSEATEALSDADIVINLTSLGLHESDSLPVLHTDWMQARQCFVDVIYNPRQTQFLACAKAQGGRTINGLAMLVAQAAYAFALFCDQAEVPFKAFFNQMEALDSQS